MEIFSQKSVTNFSTPEAEKTSQLRHHVRKSAPLSQLWGRGAGGRGDERSASAFGS